MKATDIFTPGSLPQHTYYDREALRLEWRLLEAIETKGFISSVSGPSKSGKTVLCETVVGRKKLLIVTGGGVSSEAQFWHKLRQKLGLPAATTADRGRARSADLGAQAGAKLGIPFVAEGKGEIAAKAGPSACLSVAFVSPCQIRTRF